MPKKKPQSNPIAVAHSKRGGAGAGPHKSKRLKHKQKENEEYVLDQDI